METAGPAGMTPVCMWWNGRPRAVRVAAVLAAAAIFVADLWSPLRASVTPLYLIVIVLTARVSGRGLVLASGASAAILIGVGFLVRHAGGGPAGEALDGTYVRLGVNLTAVALTTLLSLRDRSSRSTLAEQAQVLELIHDTVIIRDVDDVILYWNDGAERLYGWTRAEAVGKVCDALLHCQFPTEEAKRALETQGQWSGEVSRMRRDGTRLVLASRWLMRRDQEGRPVGVMETGADLTEQRRAAVASAISEQRYGAIFHAAGFAIWESDWSAIRRFIAEATAGVEGDLRTWLAERPDLLRAAAGMARIQVVNQAAVELFEAEGPAELVGTSVIGRFLGGAEQGFAEILAALARGADVVEAETRLTTFKGRTIEVVLRATLVPEGEPWSRALVMAFDETERKEARARLEQASAELAHAARVSTLGQLAASIAHEVNQPLTAVVAYGKSGRRWLARPEPDLDEALQCFDHIVMNANRATEVISRVRALARKAAPQAEPLQLVELVDEAVALVQREAQAAGVAVRRVLDEDFPTVVADRVQVQQVVVNLLMNGVQAMREVEGRPRELCVSLRRDPDGAARVAVQDCGTGIAGDPSRIFEPFFTTKADGMGIGLSICRSIIQAQGGEIAAANNPDHGATIAFTLPAAPLDVAPALSAGLRH